MPLRAELPDVNINTGAQSIILESVFNVDDTNTYSSEVPLSSISPYYVEVLFSFWFWDFKRKKTTRKWREVKSVSEVKMASYVFSYTLQRLVNCWVFLYCLEDFSCWLAATRCEVPRANNRDRWWIRAFPKIPLKARLHWRFLLRF